MLLDESAFTLLNVALALTQDDLEAIKDIVKITIDEELEQKLNEKLKTFPTKEEFFTRKAEVRPLSAWRERL